MHLSNSPLLIVALMKCCAGQDRDAPAGRQRAGTGRGTVRAKLREVPEGVVRASGGGRADERWMGICAIYSCTASIHTLAPRTGTASWDLGTGQQRPRDDVHEPRPSLDA